MANSFFKKTALFSAVGLMAFGTAMAQSGEVSTEDLNSANHSVSLKTIRSLFPNRPTTVANDMFGGLHSVATVAELHGVDAATDKDVINDEELQTGMIVYIGDLEEYYVYTGEVTGEGVNNEGSTNAATAADLDNNGVDTRYWKSLNDVTAETLTIDEDNDRIDTGANGQVVTGAFSENTTPAIGDHHVVNDAYGVPIQTFVYEGTHWQLVSEAVSVSAGDNTPNTGDDNRAGDVYINNTTNQTLVYDGDSWEVISEQNTVTNTGTTAPTDPVSGDIWYNPTAGETRAYDGDTNQWYVISTDYVYTESVVVEETTVIWTEGTITGVVSESGAPTDPKIGDVIKLADGHTYACTSAGTDTGVATDDLWIRLSKNASVTVDSNNDDTDNDPNGANGATGDLAGEEGDTFISEDGNTYIHDGSDSDPWQPISTPADIVQSLTETDDATPVEITVENLRDGYTPLDVISDVAAENYKVGDIVKLTAADGSFITYVLKEGNGTTDTDWEMIAEDVAAAAAAAADLPVYQTAGSVIGTDASTTVGTAAPTQDAYLGAKTTVAASGVTITYPAAWDLHFVLMVEDVEFDIAAGAEELGKSDIGGVQYRSVYFKSDDYQIKIK